MQEEGGVISGLLVGLNIIDCNFDLKGDSLDVWVSEKHKLEVKSLSDNVLVPVVQTVDLIPWKSFSAVQVLAGL